MMLQKPPHRNSLKSLSSQQLRMLCRYTHKIVATKHWPLTQDPGQSRETHPLSPMPFPVYPSGQVHVTDVGPTAGNANKQPPLEFRTKNKQKGNDLFANSFSLATVVE